MKRINLFFAVILLLGLSSSSALGIEFEESRHLLARTGFGSNLKQIQHFQSMDQTEAVTAILNQIRKTPLTPPPEGSVRACGSGTDERARSGRQRGQRGAGRPRNPVSANPQGRLIVPSSVLCGRFPRERVSALQ